MKKIPKQEYTAEYKTQAVKRAQEVGVGPASRELGRVEQTLRNWFKAGAGRHAQWRWDQAGDAEQMALSRLTAENVRLKMHVEI